MIVTQSAIKTFLQCPKRYYYKYELGVTSRIEVRALTLGTTWHRILARLWNGLSLTTALDSIPMETDPFDRAQLEGLAELYFEKWPFQLASLIEATLATPVISGNRLQKLEGVILKGCLDAVDSKGRVVEHKTTSEDIDVDSPFWTRVAFDLQVSAYCILAGTTSCLYDVVKKSALKPLKATPAVSQKFTKEGSLYKNQRAEDEPPWSYKARVMEASVDSFSRRWVSRTSSDLDAARQLIFDTCIDIDRAKDRDCFHRHNGYHCAGRSSSCEFVSICSGQNSIDDDMFIKIEPFAELEKQ